MPSRNIQKIYAPHSYYHIFNRGAGRQLIFIDDRDYVVFLSLLKRLLGREVKEDLQGREYPNFYKEITLLAYCLMPNHYHLLIYQKDSRSITGFIRSLCTAYTMYFNQRHNGSGHLFQGRFKASMINNAAYLQHISRYIHLNPSDYQKWEYSSLPYYLGEKSSGWLRPVKITRLFDGTNYSDFLSDYKNYGESLRELKSQLADS